MLELPNVTLIVVETRLHALMRRALLDAVCKVQFADVLIYTDDAPALWVPETRARYFPVPDWPTKEECGMFFAWDAHKPVTTSHYLILEWDAGIWDTSKWSDEFLEYDYIGSPWGWEPTRFNVGNGGFSLRSTRLADFLSHYRKQMPESYHDKKLCRDCRPELEKSGFKWALADVAYRFSHEGDFSDKDAPSGWEVDEKGRYEYSLEHPREPETGTHFGFHYTYHRNWINALSPHDRAARMKLLAAHFGQDHWLVRATENSNA